MRNIGTLKDATLARRFASYLTVQGIESEIEQDGQGHCALWIKSDDDLEAAMKHLLRFEREPDHRDFSGAELKAAALAAEVAEQEKARAARTFSRSDLVQERKPLLTFALMAACVVVFFITGMGEKLPAVTQLTIAAYEVRGDYIQWEGGLQELRRGEFWRLITPIFLHFGPLHILFNMLWLKDLGAAIEYRISTRFLATFVLLVAVSSNVAQYFIGGAPNFGGMSGVVYALLGFIWMKGKYDAAAGMGLPQHVVAMMLIWYFLCLFGFIKGVANIVHTVGLLMGALWGYLSARRSAHFLG